MWGVRNKLDRNMSNYIFEKTVDKAIAAMYINQPKGLDQSFLATYFYNQLRSNSVIHDSHLCQMYHDSTPWPSRRIGDFYVGSSGKFLIYSNLFPCKKFCIV
jgi:hypothetical protein